MTFLDLIEKLRAKPLAYRKRVAFFTTSIFTGLIFIVWLFTFNYHFTAREIDEVAVAKELRPFEEIKASIGNFYDSVRQLSSSIFSGDAATSSDSSVAEKGQTFLPI